MRWKLFADLAEVAGTREVTVDSDVETVGEALDGLLDVRPELGERILDESGTVADHVTVLRNGTDVSTANGMATAVNSEDELALFPPVSGG